MAAKEKYPEPTYLESGFGELEHRVISEEICCKCGTCEAFCPKIAHHENKPTLTEYDPLCGLCFAYCPRTFLDMPELEKTLYGRARNQDEPLGIYKKAATAKAAPVQGKAQDGGIVTALLVQALKSGMIDCAVVTDRDENWRTVPKVATTPDEIIAAAGTKYTTTNTVIGVQQAMDMGFKKIAFVGTPCQIQAMRKVQLLKEPYEIGQEKIALVVGLFCMENFDYDALMNGLIKGKFGLDPKDIERFEINKGMFRVIAKGKPYEIPIAETDQYTSPGCGPCFDFASELADISVGSVGSPQGWSTVLVRTEAGEKAYQNALTTGAVEEKPLADKGKLLAWKLAASKNQRFDTKAGEIRARGGKVEIKR
jgi:coenzyme F420 hydrogenase subunit beta